MLVSVTFMPSNRQTDTVGGWSVLTLIANFIEVNHQTKDLIHIYGRLSDTAIDVMLDKSPFNTRVPF